MLIFLSLTCLILISVFAMITGSSIKTIGLEGITSGGNINQTQTTYDITNLGQTFYIDEFVGAMVIIIAVISICVIVGLRIFNTGLSEQSVKMITLGITYISIWSIFSTLSYDLIITIEVIGSLLYILLTVIYILGIVQKFMEF